MDGQAERGEPLSVGPAAAFPRFNMNGRLATGNFRIVRRALAHYRDGMKVSQFTAGFANWAIVAAAGIYRILKIPLHRVGAPDVLAIHPDEESARGGLKRVERFAGLRVPELKGTRVDEAEFRKMLDRVLREVAMPAAQPDDPATR